MGRTRRLRYRHLRRTTIAVLATVAAFLLVILVAKMLLTAGPTRRLAREWIEAVAKQRDLDVEIDDLSWGFIPPRLHLEGLRVEGPGIRAAIETADVDLARIWLTRQTIELGTVAADGVKLALDGTPSSGDREEAKLKVKVRHLDLTRVEFVGTDMPGKIDLSLIGMDLRWSSEDGPPTGYVRIDRADLRIPGLSPFSLALAARLRIEDGLHIPSWTVASDGISLRGEGTIGGQLGTSVAAAGAIDLTTLDRIVKAGGILSGTIDIEALIQPNEAEPVGVEIRSRHIEAAGFPLDNLAGRLVLADGRLRGEIERATFFGGRLNGRYSLGEFGGSFPHKVQVNGRGVEVAGILRSLGISSAGIAAELDADVELDWNGSSFPLGNGRAETVFHPTEGVLPASGPLLVELKGDRALSFSTDELRIGNSVLSWQGPLAIGSWQPSWSVTATPAILEEIVPMVNSWIGSAALPAMEGTGRLQVSLSGPWQELVVRARLDARPLRWGPVALDHVVTNALIGGKRLTLEPSRFSLGDGSGEIEGSLTWDPNAGDEQLALDLRGHRLPMATIAKWAGLDGMADGAFSFTGGLRGALGLPRGSWAAGLADVVVAGLELGDATATIDLADGRFEARGLDFDDGLQGRVWWQVGDGEVGTDLSWNRMPLAFLGDTITCTIGDTTDVHLAGRLTPDGHPTGNLVARTEAGNITITAEADRWVVRGGLADAVDGSVELLRREEGQLAGSGELRLTSAQGLLARVVPDSGIPLEGTAVVHVDIDWPSGSLPIIAGTVEELDLDLQEDPVRLLGPAHFSVSADGLEVHDLYLGHRNDRVFMRWGIGADGSIHGNTTGTLDGLLLRFLVPEWEPAGRATGVIEMLGTLDRPRFEGIAEIAQGSFRLPGGQTILSGIDGTILLSQDEVVIDGSGFRFMQGRGIANGRINWRAGMISLDLAGEMNGLRYPVLPGLIARLSGHWRLNGPTDDLHISGDLKVDRASLQRREAPSMLILEWFGGASSPPGEGGPSLDLRIEADQTVELRSPFVRLVGSANLHVTGTTNRPGLVGKVEFEEGGEITLQNLRYDLERGIFTFADPERIDPSIELQLTTWVQNYQVTLRVSGTSDRLIPQVTSSPPLPQEQVYSLLAMGYRSDSLGSGAMGVGLASTILSQQISSELDRRTKWVLPHVRVDPFASNPTSGPAARVTVVQQLAPNWTVTLQSNLSSERAEVIVSRWYLAPGIFLEASRDLDGSYGLDIKMRRPY
jgi:autotransporter translocation and assembly factor TamB